jgi:inner membrane protein involved in colicin E2 resistance
MDLDGIFGVRFNLLIGLAITLFYLLLLSLADVLLGLYGFLYLTRKVDGYSTTDWITTRDAQDDQSGLTA